MGTKTTISTQEEFNSKTPKVLDGLTNYCFGNIIFTTELNLSENANIIKFEHCVFKENVTLPSSINQDSTFADSIFEKDVSFCNATFKKKVRFHATEFKGKTNFINTKFNDLADFWNAKFSKTTIFYKTDFLGTTVFSSTTFEENVLFTYSLIGKLIIFRGTNFNKGIDLSLAIISGNMSVFDISILDFKDVNDTNEVYEFGKNVSELGIITRKNKRETYRIIKNQLVLNQNSIDALGFAELEMNAYAKQLYQSVFIDKNKKAIQNFLLLKLNLLSSNHGTSWWRGVLFSFGIGLLFFYASIIATDNYVIGFENINLNNVTTCVKYFFTFMLPTHGIDYLDNENPKMFFYFWDFCGRIFVSYGIYQTIQAFRKYKNK